MKTKAFSTLIKVLAVITPLAACGSKSSVKKVEPQPLEIGSEDITEQDLKDCSITAVEDQVTITCGSKVTVLKGCSSEAVAEGNKITCGDQSFVVPAAEKGETGEKGDKGEDGKGCTATKNADGTATVTCGDGAPITLGTPAADHPPATSPSNLTGFLRKELVSAKAERGSNFGTAVAVDGNTMVVSSPQVPGEPGRVEVFERNWVSVNSWAKVKELKRSIEQVNDEFGAAVDISGDYIVVGAPGLNDERGAVFIFKRNAGGSEQWGQVQLIQGATVLDRFGHSVAIRGNHLAVGAPGFNAGAGRVDFYYFNGTTFVANSNFTGASANDRFGTDVDVDATYAVIGAPRFDTAFALDEGRATVYRYNSATNLWILEATLSGSGLASGFFGQSVAIDDETIVVGAPAGNNSTGEIFIFARTDNTNTWTQVDRYTTSSATGVPTDGDDNDGFGSSVAIDGDRIIVGAPFAGSNASGRIYVLKNLLNDMWSYSERADGGLASARFGASVAVTNDIIAVGAPSAQFEEGRAYVYYKQ